MSEDGLPYCSDVRGSQWAPDDHVACGNRAKWRQVNPPRKAYCGRHVRYVGPVEPIRKDS